MADTKKTETKKTETKKNEYIILKCKPSYNFQSVEFEWKVKTREDLSNMTVLYKDILLSLMQVVDEVGCKQNNATSVQPISTFKPASSKQIELAKRLGLEWEGKSMSELQKDIKAALDK